MMHLDPDNIFERKYPVMISPNGAKRHSRSLAKQRWTEGVRGAWRRWHWTPMGAESMVVVDDDDDLVYDIYCFTTSITTLYCIS